jgi:hypothetical protein
MKLLFRMSLLLDFGLSQIVGFELEIRPKSLDESDLPELTFHAGWPTIWIPDLEIGEPAKREWDFEVVFLKDPKQLVQIFEPKGREEFPY